MSETKLHTPDRKWIRIQAWSGLIFATFLVLHLMNTMLASLGQGIYDAFMETARRYYQFPVIEAVILLSVVVHVIAGIARWRFRRRVSPNDPLKSRRSLRSKMHKWTGYFLAIVLVGHVLGTRGPGWFFNVPADFSFLTFSIREISFLFYPYYFILGICGTFHVINGCVIAISRLFGIKFPHWMVSPTSKWFWMKVVGSSFIIVLGILAFGGMFFEVDVSRFEEFKLLYERVVPDVFVPWK